LNTPVGTIGMNLAFMFIGGQSDLDSVAEPMLVHDDHVSVHSPSWLS
jgi:hypothetical protein